MEHYIIRGDWDYVNSELEKGHKVYLDRFTHDTRWALVQYLPDDTMIVTLFNEDNEVLKMEKVK